MAKKNYYVVKRGRKPGIYRSWPDCEEQVKGFSGAIYRGFSYQSEAEDWYNKGKTSNKSNKRPHKPSNGFKYGKCRPTTVNTKSLTSFYDGDIPPWEFPSFIGCIEYEVNVNNFSWR